MKTPLNTNRPLRASLRTLLAGLALTAGALSLAAGTPATATVIDDFSQGQSGMPVELLAEQNYSAADNISGVWGGTRTIAGEVASGSDGLNLDISSDRFIINEFDYTNSTISLTYGGAPINGTDVPIEVLFGDGIDVGNTGNGSFSVTMTLDDGTNAGSLPHTISTNHLSPYSLLFDLSAPEFNGIALDGTKDVEISFDFDLSTLGGTDFNIDSISFLSPVPEPSTWALGALAALGGVGLAVRRRKARARRNA